MSAASFLHVEDVAKPTPPSALSVAVAAQGDLDVKGIDGLHNRVEDTAGRPLDQSLHGTLKREAWRQVSGAVAALTDSRTALPSRMPLRCPFMGSTSVLLVQVTKADFSGVCGARLMLALSSVSEQWRGGVL